MPVRRALIVLAAAATTLLTTGAESTPAQAGIPGVGSLIPPHLRAPYNTFNQVYGVAKKVQGVRKARQGRTTGAVRAAR